MALWVSAPRLANKAFHLGFYFRSLYPRPSSASKSQRATLSEQCEARTEPASEALVTLSLRRMLRTGTKPLARLL